MSVVRSCWARSPNAARAWTRKSSRRTLACATYFALLWASAIHATPNPSLYAEVEGISNTASRRELSLSKLEIDITIEGSIAQTTLTASFAGVASETLEGHFALALPENAIVNGYALDIDERMIEGALIPRPKARDVYDSKVRRTIDPGIGELASSNLFTTQVYPIREDSGRTIRVSFAAPVHHGFTLPLATAAKIDALSIKMRARDVSAAPKISLPSGLTASWQRTRDGFALASFAQAKVLDGALSIGSTLPRRDALISTDRNGGQFFQVRDIAPPEPAHAAPDRIRLYWDRSLSRRDDRLVDEIDLLDRYVRSYDGVEIDLIVFNSTGATVDTVHSADQLRSELVHIEYRGATSFAVLDALNLPRADVCLLFSDGAATIDRRDTFEPDCTLKVITSAPEADRGYLAQLTRESGGVVIRLSAESAEAAYRRLTSQSPIIIGASTIEGRPLAFTVIENDNGGWFVVGEAPRSDELVLHFLSRRGRPYDQHYRAAKARRTRFDGAAALWAADQIAALAANEASVAAIERVSRRYSIASTNFAFVVLDAPQDYVNARVQPPKDYPDDQLAEYKAAKLEYDAELAEARTQHVEDLRAAWNRQKQWWEHDFDPRAKPRPPTGVLRNPSAAATGDFGIERSREDLLESVVVTGTSVHSGPPTVSIAMEAWQPDRPYLRALDDVSPQEVAKLLAQQQTQYGDLPAFYLDTAEWLFQHERTHEASEMLLSALELPVSNDETRAIVADRLLRYGYFDRAIWLYEQTAKLADYRPQPRMQLASALAKRATVRTQSARRDLRRAIELLNAVAMTPWGDAYEGASMIALMEANALIPRLQRAGGARVALAPELIALLDLDIRVVIQWNTSGTDLDLWVDEPNGERAVYNNPRTAIGGRLSDDMTQGFGPEEYLLRHSPPGEYRVNIDVFATDSINPNGATVVSARLIHDFGRENEREEAIDIELLPDETGEKLVGRILVGGGE